MPRSSMVQLIGLSLNVTGTAIIFMFAYPRRFTNASFPNAQRFTTMWCSWLSNASASRVGCRSGRAVKLAGTTVVRCQL